MAILRNSVPPTGRATKAVRRRRKKRKLSIEVCGF
jgi:hypothetical protein